MNSKFLIKNTLFNSNFKWKLSLASIQLSKNLHCFIFDKKPKFLKESLAQNQLNLNLNQIRTTIRGGPGYTKYAHGRYKPNISKFAYFWYAFLVGGLVVALFFDFESFLFRGQEPEEKANDLKRLYDRMSVPKAKQVSNSSENSEIKFENDNSENEDEDNVVDSTNKKKSKETFRNRKVNFRIFLKVF